MPAGTVIGAVFSSMMTSPGKDSSEISAAASEMSLNECRVPSACSDDRDEPISRCSSAIVRGR